MMFLVPIGYNFLSSAEDIDTIPPEIFNINCVTSNPLDTNPEYGWVNVSCDVIDNVAVSEVILNINNPVGTWNHIPMVLCSQGRF